MYHFLASVVGGQECGAFSVVRPGAVDTGHLLPAAWRITLPISSPWMSAHSLNISITVRDRAGWWENLCSFMINSRSQISDGDTSGWSCIVYGLLWCHTSVVEIVDVVWTQYWNQLTRSAPWPADDPVPLRDTVTIYTNHWKHPLVIWISRLFSTVHGPNNVKRTVIKSFSLKQSVFPCWWCDIIDW